MSGESPETPEMTALQRRGSDELVERRLKPGRHPSSMLDKVSWWTRFFLKRVFRNIRFDRRCIDNIREAAERGTVVYVMQTRSLLDYLYFNFVFLAHALPLARFANGVRTTLFRPFFNLLRTLFQRGYPPRAEVMQRTVAQGQPVCLFLQKPRDEWDSRQRFSQDYLRRLIDLADRRDSQPITLVPLLLVWEKRSESYHKTLFVEVFGSRQTPGPVRKFLHMVRNVWESLWRAGAPAVQVASGLELNGLARENALLTRSERAHELDEQLMAVFERERRVIVGPPLKSAALIRREVLESERVDRAIRHITQSKPEYPSVVKKQARKIIKEIAADFSLVTIKFLSALMNPIFDTLYQGYEVDAQGLDRVREVARDQRILLVPSHKSHMDYLLLSNVFYQHGLMPPHIAAGSNLSFWPVGGIFRRAGAFFLRRSFRDDELYSAIFTEYLLKILREGFPVEFFIEGTRSRTGKLMRPRYGMLGMVFEAVVEDDLTGVALVPVSIGYERIVEARSYHREMLGAEKEAENLSGVLKATRVLRTKYGRVYVNFADPVSVDDFATEQSIGPQSGEADRELAVRRLAYRVLGEINEVTPVTPSALVATALLSSQANQVDHAYLLTQTGFVLNYLIRRGARVSNSIRYSLLARGLRVPESGERPHEAGRLGHFEHDASVGVALEDVVREAVRLFSEAGCLKVRNPGGQVSYASTNEQRIELSYYRNNIVHFFIPDSILATAMGTFPTRQVGRERLQERSLELVRLLKHEFCFSSRSDSAEAYQRCLDLYRECGWLTGSAGDETLERAQGQVEAIGFLQRVLASWIEGYWVAAGALGSLHGEPTTQKEFFKACLKQGRRHFVDRTIAYYESLSRPTFENALRLFKELGVVEEASAGEGRGERAIRLGESYRSVEALTQLRGELERFLLRPRAAQVTPVPAEESLPSVTGAE